MTRSSGINLIKVVKNYNILANITTEKYLYLSKIIFFWNKDVLCLFCKLTENVIRSAPNLWCVEEDIKEKQDDKSWVVRDCDQERAEVSVALENMDPDKKK